MAEAKPLVPVIVGPTAVGKTAVVMALAKHWPITVVSADSRQVYRRLDIGTAKPSPEHRRRVPHLGLDLIDPGEQYSAGRFAADAASWLRALSPNTQPVVVGGTGFYVRALADGLFQEPPMNSLKRAQLRQWTDSAAGMGRIAARLDEAYSGGGRQRAARAVEVALLTGRPLSWWQRRAQSEGVMRPWYVVLRVPRPILHERIECRIRDMLAAGLVDEVRDVLADGVPPSAPGLDAVGYREVLEYLTGGLQFGELAQQIATGTRRYAKRQETWFRHQLGHDPVLTLDATVSPDELAMTIITAWKERTDECESE